MGWSEAGILGGEHQVTRLCVREQWVWTWELGSFSDFVTAWMRGSRAFFQQKKVDLYSGKH